MCDYNTDSNNSDSKSPRRFGEEIPTDPDRQAELVQESMQQYLRKQRFLEQGAMEYLSRSVYYDQFGQGHEDEG